MLVASPCYLRNAAATGNPIFPFGYGVFGGRNWSAEAARGLDDYYAAYRETYAQKRGGRAYGSWREALRFPWDATMAPYAFENVGRFAYDVGPFVLAFLPRCRSCSGATRARGSSPASGSPTARSSCSGCGPTHATSNPTLPLFLVVAVQALWMLGSTAARRPRGGRGARVHGGAAGRDGAPSPGAARAATACASRPAAFRRTRSSAATNAAIRSGISSIARCLRPATSSSSP